MTTKRSLSVLEMSALVVLLLAVLFPADASIPRDAAVFLTTHPISTIRQSDGAVTPLLSDAFGNVVASVTNGTSVVWNPTRVGGYGPLPGCSAAWLSTNTTLAAATVWRGKRMDPTGYYWQGARYYDPVGGRFLSPDPLGHEASMDLYSYADGDPINECDPDGRFGKNSTSSPVTWNSNGIYNDPIAPYVAALKRQTAIDMGLDPEGAAEQQYYGDMLRTVVSAVPVVGMFGSYVEATSGRALFTGQSVSQGDALLGFGMSALGTVSMAKMGVSPSPLQSSLMPRSAARMELPTLSSGSAAAPKPTQLEFDFVRGDLSGKLTSWNTAERTVGHHTIPRAIQSELRPSVRNHPDVRGRRGNPNIRQIPESTHRQIHSSPAGDYHPGGAYNRRFNELIIERGGYLRVTPQDILDIRNQLIREFGI